MTTRCRYLQAVTLKLNFLWPIYWFWPWRPTDGQADVLGELYFSDRHRIWLPWKSRALLRLTSTSTSKIVDWEDGGFEESSDEGGILRHPKANEQGPRITTLVRPILIDSMMNKRCSPKHGVHYFFLRVIDWHACICWRGDDLAVIIFPWHRCHRPGRCLPSRDEEFLTKWGMTKNWK